MKILLAYKCHDLGKAEFYSRFTPLGLGSICAVLRENGFDAVLVNASSWSWDRTTRFLEAERPDVLGISVFTFNRHEAMRLAALARSASPRCLIVAGGPHATHLPRHLLEHYPQVDLVVRGEGEEAMLEIVRAHAGRGATPALPSIRGVTYRAATEIVPAFHLAHSLLGSAVLRMRQREAASACFSRALALCPDDPVARLTPASSPPKPDW